MFGSHSFIISAFFARFQRLEILVLLWVLAFSATSASQAWTPHVPRTKQFGFFPKTVELEGEDPDYHRYRIQGVTNDGWRFLIDCADFPPYEVVKETMKRRLSQTELAQQEKEYKDFQEFRKVVLEKVALASLGEGRTRMIIYRDVDRVFADCPIVKSVENGSEMFFLIVASSEFRHWKDGTGYEVEAHTEKESLTLACVEKKGAICVSIEPSTYRATRLGSEMRLYDLGLNLIGAYRIFNEKSSPSDSTSP